jgi:hypothetical protein
LQQTLDAVRMSANAVDASDIRAPDLVEIVADVLLSLPLRDVEYPRPSTPDRLIQEIMEGEHRLAGTDLTRGEQAPEGDGPTGVARLG